MKRPRRFDWMAWFLLLLISASGGLAQPAPTSTDPMVLDTGSSEAGDSGSDGLELAAADTGDDVGSDEPVVLGEEDPALVDEGSGSDDPAVPGDDVSGDDVSEDDSVPGEGDGTGESDAEDVIVEGETKGTPLSSGTRFTLRSPLTPKQASRTFERATDDEEPTDDEIDSLEPAGPDDENTPPTPDGIRTGEGVDFSGGLLSVGQQAAAKKKFNGGAPVGGRDPPAQNREGAVDWLRNQENARGGWGGFYTFATWMANSSGTSAQTKAVADAGRGIEDPRAQLQAMVRAAHQQFGGDPSKVCRHYAMLLNAAAGQLGHNGDLHVNDGNSHAWSQVTMGGRTFIVDPLNNIVYEQE